jgi:transcriptional regulator with XRE-family HTH domain
MIRNTKARLDPRTLPAIARRMQLLRMTTGLSISEFARETGIARTMWHNIESGFSRISVDAAMKLCDKYTLTLDWVFRGDDRYLTKDLTKRLEDAEASLDESETDDDSDTRQHA